MPTNQESRGQEHVKELIFLIRESFSVIGNVSEHGTNGLKGILNNKFLTINYPEISRIIFFTRSRRDVFSLVAKCLQPVS
jgi:hypothetical protein